jgi:predicted nucleotidyltransferase
MTNEVSSLNSFLTNTEKVVLEEIKEVLNSLLGARLKMFVLFGSKARGDFTLESDLDVAVVVRKGEKDSLRYHKGWNTIMNEENKRKNINEELERAETDEVPGRG